MNRNRPRHLVLTSPAAVGLILLTLMLFCAGVVPALSQTLPLGAMAISVVTPGGTAPER